LSAVVRPSRGAPASDLLSRIRAEIDERREQLRPAQEEYERLLSAAEAMSLDLTGAAASARGSRRPAQRKPAAAKAPSARAPERKIAAGSAPAAVAVAQAEPEAQTAQMRPRARGRRGSAAGAIVRASSPERPTRASGAGLKKDAKRDAAQQAIVAALEHGSHTVAELGVVTAMSGASIREGLRRLAKAGAVRRAKRDGDGKAAYALSAAAGV
jgi:DNA-binding transcriptional ArsR family regulator